MVNSVFQYLPVFSSKCRYLPVNATSMENTHVCRHFANLGDGQRVPGSCTCRKSIDIVSMTYHPQIVSFMEVTPLAFIVFWPLKVLIFKSKHSRNGKNRGSHNSTKLTISIWYLLKILITPLYCHEEIMLRFKVLSSTCVFC